MRVKRQFVIENYIVDFYVPKAKTVIEIDGRQHLTAEHKTKDANRDSELAKYGITVIRYKNKDVNENFNAVTNNILKKLNLTFADLIDKD